MIVSQPPLKARRRAPAWLRYALGVALLGACVFTALQIHQFFVLRRETAPAAPPSPTTTGPALFDPTPLTSPLDLKDMPAQAGRMSSFAGHPADLTPPPGAKAIDGWQQQSYGGVRQLRIYQCLGDIDAIARHYARAAEDRGLVAASAASTSSPARSAGVTVLRFTGENLYVSVALRQENTQTVRATVVAVRGE